MTRSCNSYAQKITQMQPGKKIDHKNGTVFYHVGNFTSDLSRHEQINTFKDLFQFYEHENYPIRYCSTKNIEEAYFKIYFVNEEGKVLDDKGVEIFECPLKMDSETLATAYAPYGGKWQGYVFINDKWYWTLKGATDTKKEILPTLIHELGHGYNLDHSANPKSVMYYQEGEDQIWQLEEAKVMFNIYKDDRLEAVENSHSAKLFVQYVRSITSNRTAKRFDPWFAFFLGMGTFAIIKVILNFISR